MEQSGVIEYKRARFATTLRSDYIYTRAHFWLAQQEQGVWRIGLTKFATRMLGEMVDFGFEVQNEARVQIGEKVGWLEGFKAISDLYSVAEGLFHGSNPALESDITLVNKDPHGAGWLYSIRGSPDPENLDASGYARVLDEIIDRLSGASAPSLTDV